MDIKEEVKEIVTENLKSQTAYVKASDWIGEHNILSRMIIVVLLGILIYAFAVPLGVEYVEIVSWMVFAVFVIISVGINTVKLIGDIFIRVKGK